jgi:hypothetical protein
LQFIIVCVKLQIVKVYKKIFQEAIFMTANEILGSACGTKDPKSACGTACGSKDPKSACGTQDK